MADGARSSGVEFSRDVWWLLAVNVAGVAVVGVVLPGVVFWLVRNSKGSGAEASLFGSRMVWLLVIGFATLATTTQWMTAMGGQGPGSGGGAPADRPVRRSAYEQEERLIFEGWMLATAVATAAGLAVAIVLAERVWVEVVFDMTPARTELPGEWWATLWRSAGALAIGCVGVVSSYLWSARFD